MSPSAIQSADMPISQHQIDTTIPHCYHHRRHRHHHHHNQHHRYHHHHCQTAIVAWVLSNPPLHCFFHRHCERSNGVAASKQLLIFIFMHSPHISYDNTQHLTQIHGTLRHAVSPHSHSISNMVWIASSLFDLLTLNLKSFH